MNIVVYDIAASGGGGATILNQYIEQAKTDGTNQWWFIISLPGYEKHETPNVHILYQKELDVTGIKRWIKRFVFEHIKLNRIISEIHPDSVLSLQNMMMPKVKCPQTVYLQQSLQFAPVKFSFFKREERSYAIRQRIICRLIRQSLRKADKIIVQTKWMQEATAQWTGIPKERIAIEWPRMPMGVQSEMDQPRNKRMFFYPAGDAVYKNHRLIIDACKILKQQGFSDYCVEFTLNPTDNSYVKALYDEVQQAKVPISFIGYQGQDAMREKYAEQTLLFPSYIETFGLPLQEAQAFHADIIASDCVFAHEVLNGYDKCQFVAWDDASGWAEAMKRALRK